MADIATQLAVERLLARYVACIDDDRLEEWPSYFTEACHYQIISREYQEKGLPIGVFYANSRGMLQDRVAACAGRISMKRSAIATSSRGS
jgi:anthranilate 1,2-dioxygenase small subunit